MENDQCTFQIIDLDSQRNQPSALAPIAAGAEDHSACNGSRNGFVRRDVRRLAAAPNWLPARAEAGH